MSMSKVLVEVSIPAASIVADVLIPYECPLYYVAELLKSLFEAEGSRGYVPDGNSLLCSAETGAILDLTKSAEDSGIDNSYRMMLV
jgi:hypothetical protein